MRGAPHLKLADSLITTDLQGDSQGKQLPRLAGSFKNPWFPAILQRKLPTILNRENQRRINEPIDRLRHDYRKVGVFISLTTKPAIKPALEQKIAG